MSGRVLAVAAVLAVLLGVSVAYCQHHGGTPPGQEGCAGVAYAVPAGTGKPAPRPGAGQPTRPAPGLRKTPSRPAPKPRPHHGGIDIELDLDGC